VKTGELYIKALGTYLPGEMTDVKEARKSEPVSEFEDDFFDDDEYVSVSVAGDMPAVDMAVRAARDALDAAGEPVQVLFHAPMVEQGPQGWSSAAYILRELGLGGLGGFDIVQGGNSVLGALEIAAGWLGAAPGRGNALVTTALNAGSAEFDRWHSAGVSIVLGDGAAAMVVGGGGGIARVEAVSSLMFPEFEGVHRGNLPLFEKELGARRQVDLSVRVKEFALAHGFGPMDLLTQITTMKTEVVQRSLRDAQLEVGDIARVIHPHVGPVMIDLSAMRPLGLPLSKSTWDYGRTVGHVGSCDYLLSLRYLLDTGQLSAGDHVLLVGSGPGYNMASAVLTITGGGAR
jgi:3-oxoacyl-[acyl-carrier-protein] synthase III